MGSDAKVGCRGILGKFLLVAVLASLQGWRRWDRVLPTIEERTTHCIASLFTECWNLLSRNRNKLVRMAVF